MLRCSSRCPSFFSLSKRIQTPETGWRLPQNVATIAFNFQASYPEKLTRSRCGTGSVSSGVASVLTSPTASAPTSPGRSPRRPSSSPRSSIALPKSLVRSCYEPKQPNNQKKKTPVFFGTNNSQRQFLSKHLGHFEGSSDQFLRCMLGKYEHRERVIGLQHGRAPKKPQRKFEFAATWSSRTSVEHRWSLSTPRKRLSLSVGLSEVAGFEGLETLITSRMKPTNHLEQAERYRTSVT